MIGTAEDLADVLAAAGLGAVTGTVTIFTGDLPALPDDCMAVREMSGASPVRAMGVVSVMDRPGIQVLVRNKTYAAHVTKVTGVKGTLDGFKGIVDGKQYFYVSLAYEPVYLGRDENNRRQTSIVFDVHRQR